MTKIERKYKNYARARSARIFYFYDGTLARRGERISHRKVFVKRKSIQDLSSDVRRVPINRSPTFNEQTFHGSVHDSSREIHAENHVERCEKLSCPKDSTSLLAFISLSIRKEKIKRGIWSLECAVPDEVHRVHRAAWNGMPFI